MKNFTIGFFILLSTTCALAKSFSWQCQNDERKTISVEAKETEYTPFVQVTSENYTLSGFVNVLDGSETIGPLWSYRLNKNIFYRINFKEGVKLFWPLTIANTYVCSEKFGSQ